MTTPNATTHQAPLPAGLRAVPLACIDQLDQLESELRAIWLALGNTQDLDDNIPNLLDVREAVNGITNRLSDTLKAMGEGC